jgi:hypothetical protein
MERKFFYLKSSMVVLYFCFFAVFSAFASNGMLEGRIIIPDDVNPNSIIIQTMGLSQSNQVQTSPNAQGYFHFDHIFPVGSSVTLMVWDSNGILNRQMFFAYVSANAGNYNIYLEKNSFVRDISQSFGMPQNLISSGLCGQVTGLASSEIQGSQVTLKEDNTSIEYKGSYFNENNLPSQEQNFLSPYGYFCFFNVQTTTNTYDYTLTVHLKNSTTRSFHMYLPPYTFANNIIFDVQASLYRPAKLFSWHGKNQPQSKTGWDSVEKAFLATSEDYSKVSISSSKNDLVYFPVGEEFLTLNYDIEGGSANQFFILQPRSALFNRNILASIKNYEPGQTYVDQSSPVVVKILDSKKLDQLDLQQTYAQNMGSLFLSLDSSEFNTPREDIFIELNQLSGGHVSNFVEQQDEVDSKKITGFFYNIPAGQYQLVVTNHQGQLLWTSIVRSIANKTQVLSFISNAKILVNQQSSLPNSTSQTQTLAYTKNTRHDQDNSQKQVSMVEVFPADPNLYKPEEKFHSLHDEQLYIQNNLFFKLDSQLLCTRNTTPDNDLSDRFMGYVPVVNFFANHPILDRNRFAT